MGGVSVLLECILSKLDQKKFKIDVLVLHNNGEMLENLDSNIRMIYGTPYFDAIDYSIKDILKMKSLSLFIKKFRVVFDMKTGFIKRKIRKERAKILDTKYDVEIAFKDGFTALFTGYGESKKKIHWLHYEYQKLNPNGKYPKLFFDVLPKFDKIGVMDCFNAIYHLEDKTIVIKNLVHIEKIRERGMEMISEEEKNNPKKINFVSVGRLHPQKGYENLLKAMSMLKQEGLLEQVTLKIYGDGPLKESLLKVNKAYQLEDYIMFAGQRTNPFPYVKDSDMFILSSIYEPFGLVIVEAMSLQVPVLATSNAATAELIQNHENGFIVENSVEGIYQGLKEVIQNPKMIKNMKKKLKNYEYPISDIVKQIERVLEN